MTRINKVWEVMVKEQLDCVIIKDVTTIRYLTGFSGDSSLLYIDRIKGVLITDGRYTEQAKNEMKQLLNWLKAQRLLVLTEAALLIMIIRSWKHCWKANTCAALISAVSG